MKTVAVKMKVADIKRAYAGLSEVIQEKKLFTGEVNLAVARNNISLENHMKCYRESVSAVVNRFVLKDEAGNLVVKNDKYTFLTKEDENAYLQEMAELEKAEMEVEIMKVKYDLLSDEKHDEPTAYDLVALDFMLEY